MSNTAIIYGSNKGDAKGVAEFIASDIKADIIDAKDLIKADLDSHDKFIFVASTHKAGELQMDFQAKLDMIEQSGLKGKTLAFVGLGGTKKHADTFCSGLAEFFPIIEGANIVGQMDIASCEYDYKESKAIKDGKFIGLILDLKADPNWQAKTTDWLNEIKANF